MSGAVSFLEAEGVLRHSPPGEALTKTMAHGYLRDLEEHAIERAARR